MGDVEIWAPCEGIGYGYIPPYFPPPPYTPPPGDGFNLRLDKQADPKTCAIDATGYICEFTIRVTNTGPSPYWGPITVDDWLPTVPPAAIVTFDPQPPWVCGATGPTTYECTMAPVYMFPGESIDLYVTVTLPADTDLCDLPNVRPARVAAGVGRCGPDGRRRLRHGDHPEQQVRPAARRHGPISGSSSAVCRPAWTAAQTGAAYTGSWSPTPDPASTRATSSSTTRCPCPIRSSSRCRRPWTCTNPGPVHTCTVPGSEPARRRRRSSRPRQQRHAVDRRAGSEGRAGAGQRLPGDQPGADHPGVLAAAR